MALHGVSVEVVSIYSYDLTGMQQQQQQSVCGPTARRARFHGYTMS